jgi:hypothetical protein
MAAVPKVPPRKLKKKNLEEEVNLLIGEVLIKIKLS